MRVLLVAGDLLSTGITRHNKNFTPIGDLHFQRPMPQVTSPVHTSLSDRDSAHTGDGAQSAGAATSPFSSSPLLSPLSLQGPD